MLLYHAATRTRRVRFVLLLALAALVFLAWFGWDLLHTYGLRPADGGVLAPLPVRVAWFLGCVLAGAALFGGMLVYARCYVVSIEADDDAGALRVRTLRLLGTRERVYAAGELRPGTYHHGKLRMRHTVNAPWFTLHVPGRRVPLIVDAQGSFPDPVLLQRLLRQAPRP